MSKQIPRYGLEVANERITLCVPGWMKSKWDKNVKIKKVKLPEMLREDLKKLLKFVDDELENEGNT
jgi:hypothetical protein